MAQFGSALDWGSRGRRFKSCQPDQLIRAGQKVKLLACFFRFYSSSLSRSFLWSVFLSALYMLETICKNKASSGKAFLSFERKTRSLGVTLLNAVARAVF